MTRIRLLVGMVSGGVRATPGTIHLRRDHRLPAVRPCAARMGAVSRSNDQEQGEDGEQRHERAHQGF